MLAACPAHWRPYFTVAFWTGFGPVSWPRSSGATWSCVAGTLRVRAGRYRGHEGSPKTESSVRDVDLLPPVVEALLAHRAAQAAARLAAGRGAPDPGRDYIFTMPSGRCVDPNRLREHVWNRTIARAGVRRRTMYQTRHSFASNALAAGEAPSWVAAMLGHTTPEMLFQVYARFIPNRTRRDGSALAGRMMSNSQGRPRTPDLLPSSEESIPEPWKIASLAKAKCERGGLEPHGVATGSDRPRGTPGALSRLCRQRRPRHVRVRKLRPTVRFAGVLGYRRGLAAPLWSRRAQRGGSPLRSPHAFGSTPDAAPRSSQRFNSGVSVRAAAAS